MKTNSTKSFKEMKEAMKNEAIMDARVEVYREVIEKQERLERLGIVKKMEDSVINVMKSELNKAVLGAKKAKLNSIKLGQKAELAEIASFSNCSHPDLFAESLMENVNIDDSGEIYFCESDSKLPIRDLKTGKPIDSIGLVKEMAVNAIYKPLFDDSVYVSHNIPSKPVLKTTNIRNPWKQGDINLTQQAKILKDNPELAKQLKNDASPKKW
jgi:hypothetical protein